MHIRNIQIRYDRLEDKAFVEGLPHNLRCMLQQSLKAWARYYKDQIGPVPLKLFDDCLHVKLMCVAGVPIVYELVDHGIHATGLAQLS